VTNLQDFSRRLFAAANQLWTNTALRPDQYAHPVLALIALRQMEAKFEAVHAKLAPHFKGRLRPTPADYQARGAIFLPENARFSRLLSLPGKADLGAELNAAMKGIAEANPDLAGALPQGYAGLPNDVLQELLRLLAPLTIEGDAYGLVFEYFMGQFAASFMQKGGVQKIINPRWWTAIIIRAALRSGGITRRQRDEFLSIASPCASVSVSGRGERVGLARGARHWRRAPGRRLHQVRPK
jgi:HsdM N-terminal domain